MFFVACVTFVKSVFLETIPTLNLPSKTVFCLRMHDILIEAPSSVSSSVPQLFTQTLKFGSAKKEAAELLGWKLSEEKPLRRRGKSLISFF